MAYKSEIKSAEYLSGGKEVTANVTLPDGREGSGKSGNVLSRGNADHATQKAAEDAKSK